ncbi:helix-turn-helix transcriptional regulator [Pseudonocardia sp.]|uniref:helix-turn-helix transcriptional regulator n=1 Tax=Pseudonocardia sp. TaxID=60912 RepID=UPI003D0AFE3C
MTTLDGVGPGEPFVGRTDELATLTGELDRARGGDPSVVVVSGAAGIGKTTLLRRLATSGPPATVLRATGAPEEVALPFGIVGQLAADLPNDVRGPLLTTAPPATADPLAVGAQLLAALGELQATDPVLVVVDDAQWTDDASARALAFTVRRLRRDHVLVVLGIRDPDPGPAWWERGTVGAQPARRITLAGLHADDLVELGRTLDRELTPAAADRLREHTDGHPLHAAALLRELPADVLLDTSAALPAPRSFATLVLVRVAELAPAARALVLAAAVLGDRCPLTDAVTASGVDDPVVALDEAVRAGLLVESGRDVAFPHQLVRAAVYGDLPPARRHALHRAAAELVDGTAATAHRVAAAVGADPALAAELESQARTDAAARRWRAAADHLLSAADLSPDPTARAARLVGGVDAMLAGGDLGRALRSEPDVRALPPSAARSRVVGRLEAMTGRFQDARVSLADALDAAGDDDTRRAAAAAHLALLSLIEGDADAAAELAGRALTWGPAAEDEPTARFVRAVGLFASGDHARADAELDRDGDTAEVAALRGVVALWREDAGAAADALAAVLRDDATGMSMQARVLALAHLSEATYRIGDWDGSAAHGSLALSLARDAGVLLGAGITNALTSYVAAGRGEWDVARTRVDTALGATRLLPWWGGVAYSSTAAAVLAQARGDPAGMRAALAPRIADAAVDGPVDRVGVLPWRALLVEALLGTGERVAAATELDALALRVADRPGWTAVEAARLRAELTDLRSDYEQAVDLAGRTRAELPRARLETAFGRHLIVAGERRPGVDLLRSAHERLTRLGAAPFAARSDDALRAAGLHPPAAGGPLSLTSQELAVARLVAQGRTNREVGATLFVTGRTVAFHLSNIYAKLGISSRRDLASHL